LRATEAGAPVSLIGLVYNSTDQVLLVNADKIKSYEDFKNPQNAIALNNTGDFIYVMVSAALARNHVEINDATVIEIGGSGSRLNALLSGRIAAVPVHFDQAANVMKKGNFKILVEPWKQYKHWFSEVWVVNHKWLAEKPHQRALVDVNKAMISAFRQATRDYDYFAAGYRKYATLPGHADIADAALKPIWRQLATDIGAWPQDGGFKREYFQELIPVYRQAHSIKGTVDLAKAVEPRFVDQALQELG
jgi:NitT/TauT family transport system substrate-binding protein